MKNILIINVVLAFTFTSCQNTSKSTDLQKDSIKIYTNKALQIAFESNYKNTSESLKYLAKALKIDSLNYSTHYNKLIVCYNGIDKDLYKKQLVKMSVLFPDNPTIRTMLGIYYETTDKDSLHANINYMEADKLYANQLENEKENDKKFSIMLNQSFNLKLLNQDKKADELLEYIINNSKNKAEQEIAKKTKKMSRSELIKFNNGMNF